MQIIHSPPRMRSRGEHRAPIISQDFEPGPDIGGMIVPVFEFQTEVGAEEPGTQLRGKLFLGAIDITLALLLEAAIEPRRMTRPVYALMGQCRVIALRIEERLERRHLDMVGGHLVIRRISAIEYPCTKPTSNTAVTASGFVLLQFSQSFQTGQTEHSTYILNCNVDSRKTPMSRQSRMPEQAIGFRIEELTGLSKSAFRFVRRHPKQARMAVAAALEAAAVQYEAEDKNAAVDVPEALRPFVHQPPDLDTIGVSEAAKRLDVSRTTVYDWVGKKFLLGWKSTKRGLTIPAEQILGPGKVVPGIPEILGIIEDPELAWAFLSEEWPFAHDTARPIDKLKAGEVEEVLDAAPSFGTAFT